MIWLKVVVTYVWEDFHLLNTHRATVIWGIAQQWGVPVLSAVKLSFFTVWKSSHTVCSPLPSFSASPCQETGCGGQPTLWGAEDSSRSSLSALDTGVQRSQQTVSWLGRGMGSGGGGYCESTHKGQVSWLLLIQWATTWRLKG